MAGPTEKQERFVQEYLTDLNASAAARRAGYSPKTAGQTGFDLLKNPKIQVALRNALQRRSERTKITQDRVLHELACIAFADLRGALTWGAEGVELIASDQIDDETAAAIASISHTVTNDSGSLRVRLHDKLRALEKLGRHLGLFDGQGSQDPYESAQRIKNALRDMVRRTKVPKPSGSSDGESQT